MQLFCVWDWGCWQWHRDQDRMAPRVLRGKESDHKTGHFESFMHSPPATQLASAHVAQLDSPLQSGGITPGKGDFPEVKASGSKD